MYVRTFSRKMGNVIPSCRFRSQLLRGNFQQTEKNNCKRGGNKSVRVIRNGSLIFTIVLHSCCFPWSRNHLQTPIVSMTPLSGWGVHFYFYLKERHNNNLSKPIKTHELKKQNVTFNPISFNDKSAQLQHFWKTPRIKKLFRSNQSDKISANTALIGKTGLAEWGAGVCYPRVGGTQQDAFQPISNTQQSEKICCLAPTVTGCTFVLVSMGFLDSPFSPILHANASILSHHICQLSQRELTQRD